MRAGTAQATPGLLPPASGSPGLAAFPGAPPWAYVSGEGWLIIGSEAWTLEEWEGQWGTQWRAEHPVRPSWARVVAPPGPVGRPRIHATVADRRRAEYIRRKARQLGIDPSQVTVRPWRRRNRRAA